MVCRVSGVGVWTCGVQCRGVDMWRVDVGVGCLVWTWWV